MLTRVRLIIFLVIAGYGAQADTLSVAVSGNVHDADNPFVYINYFVVNQRINKGVFGNSKGNFSLTCGYADTIVVSAEGYYTTKITLRDSVKKGSKSAVLHIPLHKKEIVLRPVDIIPDRNLKEIKDDLENLKNPEDIDRVTVNPLESPLTALYQAFSKIERSKHRVAVMEAADRKRDVLRELLAKYVKSDIIDLTEEQFDDFIEYSNFDITAVKRMTDYDLIMYVKNSYDRYKGSYKYYLDQRK